MSLSVIYEVTHDSLWLISKQDYGSPCEMSMQVNVPGLVQLHFEWSKTSEPCKGRLSCLFFYDGLEALKRFLSIFSVLIFNSKLDRARPILAAAPVGPKTRPRDSVSQLSSTEKFSESQRIIERSITLRNSRILPGHGYD